MENWINKYYDHGLTAEREPASNRSTLLKNKGNVSV